MEKWLLHVSGLGRSLGLLGGKRGPHTDSPRSPPRLPASPLHPLQPFFSPSPLSAQAGLTSILTKGMKWFRHKETQAQPVAQGRSAGMTDGETWVGQSLAPVSAEHAFCRTEQVQSCLRKPASGGHASASSRALGLTDAP